MKRVGICWAALCVIAWRWPQWTVTPIWSHGSTKGEWLWTIALGVTVALTIHVLHDSNRRRDLFAELSPIGMILIVFGLALSLHMGHTPRSWLDAGWIVSHVVWQAPVVGGIIVASRFARNRHHQNLSTVPLPEEEEVYPAEPPRPAPYPQPHDF